MNALKLASDAVFIKFQVVVSEVSENSNISSFTPERILTAISVLVPFIIFAYHTLPLDSWIIDDAGITFAYARNLSAGHGLVSQPGMPPVEGYSNPLWVFLLAPFFWFNIFHPSITPKLLGLALVGAGFFGISTVLRKLVEHPFIPTVAVLLLIAFNAPLIIWTSSGLENALYFALGMWFLYFCIAYVGGENHSNYLLLSGIFLAFMALTRPEGIVYLILLVSSVILREDGSGLTSKLKQLSAGLLPVILIFGGYFLFRRFYFQDWLPNPAYVKGSPGLQEVASILTLTQPYLLKYRDLCASVFGMKFWLVPDFLLVIAGTTVSVLVWVKKLPRTVLLPFVMAIVSCGAFLIMTPDWMGEFRFASLYYPSIFISLTLAFYFAIMNISWVTLRVAISLLLFCGIIVIARSENIPRLEYFASRPTVPMQAVYESYVVKFNRIAAHLKLDSVSQLLPDLGSTLYESPFKTYDLAGLTDRSIAKHRGVSQDQFYNYVFDTIRPTIIHTHGFFSSVSRLERDPRFQRDYVPIRDSLEPYWNDSVLAGDYLRRDVLVGKDSLLLPLQRGDSPWDSVSRR